MTLHPDFGHGLITASTRMLLLSHPEIPVVHAELRYCREEPLAVHLVLSVEDVPATWWTFGRDLLITGTAMPSGLGDVQVYPTDDGMIVELRCDPHRVALLANTPELAAFLDRTLAMVPADAELDHCWSAAELAQLVSPDHHDTRSPADGGAHPRPPRPAS
jgi:Streptomyces sporulation and cell division protein, SsgA